MLWAAIKKHDGNPQSDLRENVAGSFDKSYCTQW